MDVVWSSSPARRPRVAVIVPRYGNSAVARNRVRRRLVDIARTVWLPALLERERDIDFVYRAKPASYAASYETLRDSLTAPLEAVCAR